MSGVSLAVDDFYSDRARGWFWREEKPEPIEPEPMPEPPPQQGGGALRNRQALSRLTGSARILIKFEIAQSMNRQKKTYLPC